ncbi:hypothetical protein [Roseibium sp. Sym1]|uniref:hypothetical protein n=1 Tax=Roseibium sp. Sym1 TaxID=3016006 RepID=UPI0022B3E304|nr:hypothetical protein [Roseibium sp. Sym1]
MQKTPREEAAYLAGRADAQVLVNLYFAGTKVRAPVVTAIQTDEQDLLEELRSVEAGEKELTMQHLRDARFCIERLLGRMDKIKKLTL